MQFREFREVAQLDKKTFINIFIFKNHFSGAGSIQTLSLRRNETKLILRELKEGLWITRGTRYVSVDFTLYNANINLFCVIK